MCFCSIFSWRQHLLKMLRKIMTMRRALHVKGDVMCTMFLLVLFCLLLYARQVSLQPITAQKGVDQYLDNTWQSIITFLNSILTLTLRLYMPHSIPTMFPGCALHWLGHTSTEARYPQLHQLQQDPAGHQWGQRSPGISKGMTWCGAIINVCAC